jgi:hypothetical protein
MCCALADLSVPFGVP